SKTRTKLLHCAQQTVSLRRGTGRMPHPQTHLLPLMRNFWCATIAFGIVLMTVVPAAAATITVPDGGNLQQAIASAAPGDTIALAPGATFIGSFTLPARIGDGVITIRTAGDDGLPGDGERVSPANSGTLAVIRATGNAPAFRTLAGAHHWTLMLLGGQGVGGADLITLGGGSGAQTPPSQIPHEPGLYRVLISRQPGKGQEAANRLKHAPT